MSPGFGNCRRRPGKIISGAIFRRGYVNWELQVQFFEKSATHASWRQFPNLVSGLNWIGLLPWNFLNFCFSIRLLTWFFFLSSGHCTLNLDSDLILLSQLWSLHTESRLWLDSSFSALVTAHWISTLTWFSFLSSGHCTLNLYSAVRLLDSAQAEIF